MCSYAKAEGSIAKGALCSAGLLGEKHESCAFRRQFWGRQEPQEPCLWTGLVERTSFLNAAVVEVAGDFLTAALPLPPRLWMRQVKAVCCSLLGR